MKTIPIWSSALLIVSVGINVGLIFDKIQHKSKYIPIKPLIVIETIPYIYNSTELGITYKCHDKNGNIFYYSEGIEYKEYCRYTLGDTLK
jgi:hypothetical protein